ncbi:Metallo-dependent phosphatase [Marasmius fiardii PR-910]|nr:Metallo-dependent phosphatase [Marasmius fiardii PR-910]
MSTPKPKSILHVDYNHLSLPPPQPNYTRFVCISDTHSHTFPVPEGDVLLHGGDLTNTGTVNDFEKTMEWICRLPHRVKVLIGGNHDLTLHTRWYDDNWDRWHYRIGKQDIKPIMELLKGPKAKNAGVIYLEDEATTFQAKEGGRSWSVYGSPWSPWFFDWAFNYQREEGKRLVSKFPKTDILLTHGPPHGIFDRTSGGDYAGCTDLRNCLPFLRPRIHVFGHIHEAHGGYTHSWKENNSKCPEVQNDDTVLEDTQALADITVDSTTFVNPANWPMGKRRADYGTKEFGGEGFRPIVVDLLD